MNDMSDDSRISFIFNLLVPPIVFCGAVLALWNNEGRFDYHAAAKDTRPIESLASAAEGSTVSYTNSLNTDPIEGYYVKDIYGFYVVERSAEIYAWEECDDESLSLCLEWSSYLAYNSRNNGVSQVMESADLYPSYYELNDLYIDGVYVDSDWRRVEFGDNPIYRSCTHREIQIPISWTENSIEVRYDINCSRWSSVVKMEDNFSDKG